MQNGRMWYMASTFMAHLVRKVLFAVIGFGYVGFADPAEAKAFALSSAVIRLQHVGFGD